MNLAVDKVFETGWETINGRPTWWNSFFFPSSRPTTLKFASFS